jgi:hypothetical protein
VSIKDLILKHRAVFKTDIGLSGGLMVSIEKPHPLAELIKLNVRDAGGSLSSDDLLGTLRGSGYTMSEFMEQVTYMRSVGSLSFEAGVYSLIE